MSLFGVDESDQLLQQVGYTSKEFLTLKEHLPDDIGQNLKFKDNESNESHTNLLDQSAANSSTTNQTNSKNKKKASSLDAIFSRNADFNKNQRWFIMRLGNQKGKKPKCKSCGNEIKLHQLHVMVQDLGL